VLVFRAAAGGETDLAERVVEAGELDVIVEVQPVRCSILLMTRPPLTLGTQ
jgi:hypothetical protein